MVRSALLRWYERERRDFPWRRTADPYAVLVSEVMLQQTQAARVSDRFERFLSRFPTAAALAEAPAATVLAEWSGLGYNRRALALQAAACHVVAHGWPRRAAELRALPGVGAYTARAVASLAFGEPVGVVDTNVRRWLIRRFGVVDRPSELQRLADRLAAPGTGRAVAAWTHATMELGARVCRSRDPLCDACPVARGCPSRGAPPSVPVRRQSRFDGSTRAARGALLRALSAAPGHRLTPTEVTARLGERADALVGALERDGLVHRTGEWLMLG